MLLFVLWLGCGASWLSVVIVGGVVGWLFVGGWLWLVCLRCCCGILLGIFIIIVLCIASLRFCLFVLGVFGLVCDFVLIVMLFGLGVLVGWLVGFGVVLVDFYVT